MSVRLRSATILGLVTLGGMAALSWELLWQIRSSLALGVSAFGTALTLAATMAGMTIGSLAMGRFLRDREPPRPLRLYGALELVIGISGLSMGSGFRLLERVDSWVYAFAPDLAPGLHVAGIALLLGPPTIAMGATIPVFALVARSQRVSIAVLYGANTAGAAIGVLLLSFVVLPNVGVSGACALLAAVNSAICAVAWAMHPERVSAGKATAASAPEGHPRISRSLAELLVFGTGLVTFGLEVAWFRSLRAAFQSTTESFAIMLASVLVPLAIGAQIAPWLRRRGMLPGTPLALAGVAILLATPLVERMDLMAFADPLYPLRLAKWAGLTMAIIGPAVLALGITLPWCLDEFAAPERAGRLYASNTLGAVFGALGSAWLLVPTLGFARTAWLLGLAVVALSLVALSARSRRWAAAAGAASFALAVAASSSIGRDRVQLLDPQRVAVQRILAYDEGPDFTVSVLLDELGNRLLAIDGFVTSSERRSASYMEWMGRLPMLLHDAPKRALVICFGTGQTANAVREEGAEHIDVVDVSQSVFDVAPLFSTNRGVLEDPKVRSVVMDGRAWVRRTQERYDVVTLEPMAPYFAGVNALYAREFYEATAQRLNPGGIVAQWLPLHLLPPLYATSVVATFQAVYPDSALWIDPGSGTGILVGRRAATPASLGEDWPGLQRVSTHRSLSAVKIRRGLSLGTQQLARFAHGGEVITDDNQLLAYSMIPGRISRFGGAGRMARVNLQRVAEIQQAPASRAALP